MLKTGAEIVVECILEQGTDTVFGLPGGSILPVFDALGAARERITCVLTSHEQAAAHAADGYARAAGRPGVCVATGGPGATNLCTGIAAAYMDSVPMVCVTGNIPAARIGTDSFQEIDIVGMTIPVTKHNYQVKRTDAVAETLREAFALSVSGRPGPVLVDIATDALRGAAAFTPAAPAPPPPDAPVSPLKAEPLLERIQRAQAPLILAGGGILRAGASSRLAELAELLDVPVVTTLMGLGAIPSAHPLFLGMIGAYGNREANEALSRADLLIAAGVRFSDRSVCGTALAEGRLPVIHLDIDRSEIGKNLPAEQFLASDAKTALDLLLRCGPRKHPEWRAWLETARGARAPAAGYAERLIDRLGSILGPTGSAPYNALVCTDVGQHQMWCARLLRHAKPGHFLTSGGAGAMGFGLGAAIGAQCACPEKTVVLVTGDGSLLMSLGELAVVARNRLPVIIVVVNNRALGMIRKFQEEQFDSRYFAADLDGGPDFALLAEAFGISGGANDTLDAFGAQFRQALERRRPALLDCRVPKE
ncbi:MAG: biosynthetic-type acetolactate synthase large subunit [Oscillospiraceae bacterium]|nr:biosynthetic-type acetolactate synthase large subunit [Oscillospiraceae bacterium]